MVTEGDLTLGGEHTMQYTDDVLQNCKLEIYIILLTNVTSINLIFKKLKEGICEKTKYLQAIYLKRA